MGEPLRVLQVVTKMDRGGLETFIMNLYRNIDRSRIQFDFLYHRSGKFDYDNEIQELGGRIFHVSRCNPLDFRYLREIDCFFANHPYSVVHSHIDCMSALPLAAAKRHGAIVRIAHSHNSQQDRDIKYPIKLICKRFIGQEATALFACGVDAGRWMFGEKHFSVVRNAIDVQAFSFDKRCRELKRKELGFDEHTLAVGHVGRFAPAKNHSFILQVFSELVKLRPNSILLLVGDGELREDQEGYAEALGIRDRVRFLGVRSDVSSLMQAMDVFLMPSVYEGLPLVLVEAQASGLPCVISDNIPRDCDLSNTIYRASLNDSSSKWAQMLDGIENTDLTREKGLHIVRAAGFDARYEAARIEEFYEKAVRECS